MAFDINVYALGTRCIAQLTEGIPLTTGCRSQFRVVLQADDSWSSMDKTIVFKAGSVAKSQYLGADSVCFVPPEVLAEPAPYLEIGVYGTIGDEIVLTTSFAKVQSVVVGARPTDSPAESPDLYAQLLAKLNTAVRTVNGQGPDENGNVNVDGSGGTGEGFIKSVDTSQFIVEDGKLKMLDVPIGNISGLQEILDNKVEKIDGKELSTNDFTDEMQEYLVSIINGGIVATDESPGMVLSSDSENCVSVDSDTGIMEVNNLNVNKLVQSDGDVLVFNCGNAQ